MGYAEEYAKKYKTPIQKCRITRFTSDIPSVDGEGVKYTVKVLDWDTSHGLDQGTSSARITIEVPLDISGDFVRFEPMDRVELKAGWNRQSTLQTVFFGFIDQVQYTNPPKEATIDCRDILKLAQDNYFVTDNRKIYYKEVVAGEFDRDGNPMGGQSEEDRTAQAIITDFLTDSGIPENRLNLDFPEYPAPNAVLIGNGQNPAYFEYEEALSACQRICDLIGYRIWADPTGVVQCRELIPIAGEEATFAYRDQWEVWENNQWRVVESGNLLDVSLSKDDNLRNYVVVIGAIPEGSDTNIKKEAYADSEYVPDPPEYRFAEIRSELIETNDMAQTIANRVLQDLNRLRYSGRATIEGDARLRIGQTVSICDEFVTEDLIENFFVSDYSHRFRSGEWVTDLTLIGGTGEGSSGIVNQSPVAAFSYRTVRETLGDSSVIIDLYLDASDSYDLNGEIVDWEWTVPGYSTKYGKRVSYIINETTGTLSVTLKVTDNGSPSLSNEVTREILLDFGEDQKFNIIYAAVGNSVYASSDGGYSWIVKELY